jgi:hypothetical protein
MNAVRLATSAGIAVAYAAAVLASAHPVALAVGLAPIVWIAVEAAWRLFEAPR